MTEADSIVAPVIIDKRYHLSQKDFGEIIVRLGLLDKITQARSIVIKPNFAAGNYISADSHVVTDLGFLHSLIEGIECLNPTASIKIAESDSTSYGFAFLKFANLGIIDWCSDRIATLDLSRDVLERVEHPSARYFNTVDRQLWLSETFLNTDFVISAANLKSHSVTRFTGASKNLFGLLPVMNKEQYHTDIDNVIHDLVLAAKVDLSIVDGFFGMERNGPVQGQPIDLGYRVFTSSPIAADLTCCTAIGLDWRHVGHLKLLAPLVKMDPAGIDVSDVQCRIAPPARWLIFFNRFGLLVQAIGRTLYLFGHRIHCADSPVTFIITIIRPLLLKVFSLETLKKWQNHLKGNDG